MGSNRAVVVLGMVVAVVGAAIGFAGQGAEPAGPAGATDPAAEIARLRDEIEQLKGMVPRCMAGQR